MEDGNQIKPETTTLKIIQGKGFPCQTTFSLEFSILDINLPMITDGFLFDYANC